MTEGTSGNVAELRIHGVSGTPPESMLTDAHPRHVAGDETGRILRRRDPVRLPGHPDRTVEAYHWGRYTAGSPSRALWLLLLPFAVLNLARFALPLKDQPRPVTYVADAVLRLLGLVLTLAIVVTSCYVAWEIIARQCTGTTCDAVSWAGWLMERSDGVRVLTAAAIPAFVVAMLWSFGRKPPAYAPPGGLRGPRYDEDLGDATFWLGALTAPRQRAAHVSAACAVIGLLALATVGDPDDWRRANPLAGAAAEIAFDVLRAVCAVGGVLALLVIAVDRQPWREGTRRFLPGPFRWPRVLAWLLTSDDLRPDSYRRDAVRIPGWQTLVRWLTAAAAAGSVAFATWAIDDVRDGSGRAAPAAATRTFEAVVALVGAFAGALLFALFAVCTYLAAGRHGRRLRGSGADAPIVPRAFRPYFGGLGACVLAALAVTVGFGFSTAVIFWTANVLGTPSRPGAPGTEAGTGAGPGIELADGYWTSAAVWGALILMLLLMALPLGAWLLRRRWIPAALLVAAAAVVTVVGAATNGGGDVVSDGAEWFLVATGLGLLAAGTLFLTPADGFAGHVRRDYPRGSGGEAAHHVMDDLGATGLVVRRWRVAMARYRYHHALAAFATLGGLAAIVWAAACLATLSTRPAPMPRGQTSVTDAVEALTTVGVVTVTLLAAALFGLGLASWRRPRVRTMVGIIWDMLSFWPRVAHPLCPLPYGGRAVRAVAKRAAELGTDDLDHGAGAAPAQPFTAVVVSGHSQGSVIAVAAAAVLERTARCPQERNGWVTPDQAAATLSRLSLVTYGSQLQFIYARMFPTYLGFERQRVLFQRLGGRWRNVYRWTDPLGGPVLSWPHSTGTAPNERYGPSATRWSTMACADLERCPGHTVRDDERWTTECHRAHVRWHVGPDVRLRDPSQVEENPYAPRLPARGHGGYPGDPGFDAVIAELVAGRDSLPACPAAAGAGEPGDPDVSGEPGHDHAPRGDLIQQHALGQP